MHQHSLGATGRRRRSDRAMVKNPIGYTNEATGTVAGWRVDCAHVPARMRADWFKHLNDLIRPIIEPTRADVETAVKLADAKIGNRRSDRAVWGCH